MVIQMPILEKKWYCCPNCGKKLFLYDNTAYCDGIYIKCKECKCEIKVNI